jgi:tryptophanyl-tRNA synthetase
MKKARPSLLHTTFLPGLRGPSQKMSSSDDASVMQLCDSDDAVRKKLRSAFSGGRATLKELQEKGADLDADVAFQYLRYLLQSDAELDAIAREYKAGRMSTGAVKDRAADVIVAVLREFRERRAAVTDATIERFCAKRMLTTDVANNKGPAA